MENYAIQLLDGSARASVLAHLISLSLADRYRRFGGAIAPSVIADYVGRTDFVRDAILGVSDDQTAVVGLAHAAFAEDPAEVALSVLPSHRNRGLGRALLASAVGEAIRRGAARVLMRFESDNAPMLRIAQRFGTDVRLRGRDSQAIVDVQRVTQIPITRRAQLKEQSCTRQMTLQNV